MGVIKRNGNTYGGGGGASADGKAESSAIAPVFDDTETYAAGDRVMYEDELYVFNKAHTGAWDAADADKTDVDSEIPAPLTSQQMQEIKDAFSGMNKGAPLRMMHYSTEEQVVGTWIDGKPLYQKTIVFQTPVSFAAGNWVNIVAVSDIDSLVHTSVLSSNKCEIMEWTAYENGYVRIFSKNTANNVKYLTIQYTKTTDTPQ